MGEDRTAARREGLPGAASARLATALLETARTDTAFADLYLRRARALLAAVVAEPDYLELKAMRSRAAMLHARIRDALDAEDWQQVRDLTARLAILREMLAATEDVWPAAQAVFEFQDVLIDPFSRGLSELAGVATRDLASHRNQTVERLEVLAREDPEWKDFYDGRRAALASLSLDTSASARSPPSLRSEALQAFARGDFGRLHEVSVRLLDEPDDAPDARPRERTTCPGQPSRAATSGLAASTTSSGSAVTTTPIA